MTSKTYNIPILLITFNRPNHIRSLMAEIRKQKPTELFISQDGPRDGNDKDLTKILEVRNIISKMIDWPCQVHTFYHETNLGCGPSPYAAISWFFQNVDKGIILEDDIVPHPLFFTYMENLLNRYSDDERVGVIMGHNLFRKYSLRNSYYFTYDTEGTLGWGTWRRVWDKVDFNVVVNEQEFNNSLKEYYHFPIQYRNREINHFINVLNCDRHDRWDCQLEYCLKKWVSKH